MTEKIFGYTWEQIKNAQQGIPLASPITGKLVKPLCEPEDLKLLDKHGIEGLEKMQFYGVIDRLKNSNII